MGLSGDLGEFDVGELLQILRMGRKTGILAIEGERSGGEIVLSEGEVIHAQAGAGAAGEEAFYRLVSNQLGWFSFTATPAAEEVEDPRVTITRSLDKLLLEASQRRL